MNKVKADTKFKPGMIPWNKGLVGYGKGRIVSDATRAKLSKSSSGRKHSEKTKVAMSIAKKKLVGPLNPFYGKRHSDETKAINSIKTSKRWMNQDYRSLVLKNRIGKQSGNKSPRWNGGITSIGVMIRTCEKYLKWRSDVFHRDGFKCVKCGKRRDLEAHHKVQFGFILSKFLKEYSQFSPIEDKDTLLRISYGYKEFWDISNGETNCEDCHKLNVHERNFDE